MCSLKQFVRFAISKSLLCNSLGLLTTGSQITPQCITAFILCIRFTITRMHHCLRFVHQVITTQKNLQVRSADQMHHLSLSLSHTHTQWQRWEWMDQASNGKIPFVLITNWTVTEHCKSTQQAKKKKKPNKLLHGHHRNLNIQAPTSTMAMFRLLIASYRWYKTVYINKLCLCWLNLHIHRPPPHPSRSSVQIHETEPYRT